MILRIHHLAVAEIDYEVDYYESKQVGLGRELRTIWTRLSSCSFGFPKSVHVGRDGRIGASSFCRDFH